MKVAAISFVFFMLLMTAAGAMAWIRKKKTPSDYLLASRGVHPLLTALSTVGTNNSGFMFIGMIAYTYRIGIESIWMMVGWIFGDLLAWIFVHPRVRQQSDNLDVNTIPALIGTRKNHTDRWLIAAAGLLTFVFLGIYAAGQLKAGSTALHALFEWEMYVGVLIGAAIVVIYSYAGGIRADIWTDVAQSAVMLIAMVSLLVAGYMEIGGIQALRDKLVEIDPSLIRLFPDNLSFGIAPFVIGFFFAGFSVIGQPHLMTRLMAINSVAEIRSARVYYFSWFVPFFIASVGVGLYSRVIIPDIGALEIARGLQEPTELALPLLTMELLPQIFVGFALAGLFAATVSTADSQIIVCSGAITQDMQPKWRESYLASKLATFSITTFALLIALYAPEGVFALVLIAWSVLGAGLGSVLLIRIFSLPLPASVGIAMMMTATLTVVGWRSMGYSDDVFQAMPGWIVAMLLYAAYWLGWGRKSSA
ncbi:MAG: sodium:proline symporter [Pseudohongiella sp.]|nr:sodium:proline symporter [Pseudohongiella sp.]|tara:strand:- start:4095 stop:5525 length:1431 start_codon:yes stop_codon:yes gene_type:complete